VFGTENDLGLYYEWFKCFCRIRNLSIWSVQNNILTQVRNLLWTGLYLELQNLQHYRYW